MLNGMTTVSKLSFEPHRFTKEQFKPIKDWIVVHEMSFDERITRGGLIIPKDNGKSEGIRPRWGQIYKLGPEYVGELKEGQWICVAHGRWTRGINVEDETGEHTLRRVDPNDILLVSDEPVDDFTFSDKV
jgi:co-chaperonin GroES (HSP10)